MSDHVPARRVPEASRVGVWLFLASETMFFASLLSGYVLLRAGSDTWPQHALLTPAGALMQTMLLVGVAVAMRLARQRMSSAPLWVATVLALAFVSFTVARYDRQLSTGAGPAFDLSLASWFTLTGVHLLHVIGGAVATAWLAGPGWPTEAPASPCLQRRLEATGRFWLFLLAVWLVLVVGFLVV